MSEGRTRVRRAERKQLRVAELWSGPDQRPKTKCYLCRRACVTDGLRWAYRPRKGKPFVCPWCRGRNLKFIWACVRLTLAMSKKPCPKSLDKGHSRKTCSHTTCVARRIMKTRKSEV